MTIINITTQAELDAALARNDLNYNDYELFIDSPAGVWITISDARVLDIRASGSATVWASGSATVRASGSATVRASGSATVWAFDSATVRASGSATVRAFDSATVWASDSATVWASGSATVWASGSATVRASGSATVRASGSATVRASKYTAVFLHSSRATVNGGNLIDLTKLDKHNLTDWLDYNDLAVHDDGLLHLYKAVNSELCSEFSRGEFTYEIGATVKPRVWADNHLCGEGIHLCPTPYHARRHYYLATRFLECTCKPEDFRPIDWSKGKCTEAVVLREVSIDGDPVRIDA